MTGKPWEADRDRWRELARDMGAWLDEILAKPYRVEERWNDGNALFSRLADLDRANSGGERR